MIPLVILGSTGSIGTQALDVLRSHPGRFELVGLGAGGGNPELLAAQAAEFSVPAVAVATGELPGFSGEVLTGTEGMCELASRVPDGIVLNGITGSVGLRPTLAALASGARLALANKESLVAGGALVREAMVRPGQIVPVDSEHSAIAQALASGRHEKGLTSPTLTGRSEVSRLILTASGGPFRGRRRSELAEVTPEQALDHPTWSMGPVVTINSSTLMNKGLELIEAALLFDIEPERITPVIHPQSVIHSMVEFVDGSTIAQASPPDMGLPIALGLSWPERLAGVARPCPWDEPTAWTFEPVDHEAFPALRLAAAALAAGPLHPAILNAANEECVAAFIAGRLGYLEITDTVEKVLAMAGEADELSLDAVTRAEDWARATARKVMA